MSVEQQMREFALFLEQRLNQESSDDIGVPYGAMRPDEMDDAIATLCEGVEGPEVMAAPHLREVLAPPGTGRLHILTYGAQRSDGVRQLNLIVLLYRGSRWTAYTPSADGWASADGKYPLMGKDLAAFSDMIRQAKVDAAKHRVKVALNHRELRFDLSVCRLLAERPLEGPSGVGNGSRYIDNAKVEDIVAVMRENKDIRERVFMEFDVKGT